VFSPSDTADSVNHGSELHVQDRDEIRALWTKLGLGASTPGATAAVLRRTASGQSGWGLVQGGDLGTGVGRGVTLVVAASNASALSKATADYVCDGVSDQTEIKAALAALPAVGGTVQLSEGTFTIDGQITTAKSGSHLRGMSQYATTIYAANSAGSNVSLVNLGHAYCTLSDLVIDGNKTANAGRTSQICWNVAAANCTIQNVTAQNSAGNGTGMSAVAGCRFINCQVNSAAFVGFLVDGAGTPPTMVVGCSASGNSAGGFYILGTNTHLVGCHAYGNTTGFQSDTTAPTSFSGCVATGNSTYGFATSFGSVAILGCHVVGAIGAYGVFINGGSGHTVHGCRIQDNGGYGIHVANAAHGTSIIGNHISNSSLATHNSYPQIILSAVDNCTVTGNTCRMAASGNRSSYGLQIVSGSNNYIGANDLYNSGVSGDLADGGTNTRRVVKTQLDYTGGADLSAASVAANTWTDILSNQTFRVDSLTSLLEIVVAGVISASSGNAGVLCSTRMVIDSAGTPINEKLGGDYIATASHDGINPLAGSSPRLVAGLAIGNHTVKIQVRASAISSFQCRASSLPESEFLRIQVVEHQR
jgi:parallel beta-helix repeat protein